MNEWINARKRWRGIGRRSWILAAAVAVSLSANALSLIHIWNMSISMEQK